MISQLCVPDCSDIVSLQPVEQGSIMLLGMQVASHAQKYFIRLNSMNKKDKRRSSIHDITNPGGIIGPSLSWQ